MSGRASHLCGEPGGCPVLVRPRESRCQDHQRQRDRAYNTQQRPERHKFYHTPEWRALSKQVRSEQLYCACGAKTKQADHIQSIEERPDLALDRSNVVGRCLPCHSRKTAQEDGRWGGRRQG